MTEQQAEKLGKQVAELLNLNKKDGRYDTTWGYKTEVSLGLLIERFVLETY